MAMHSPVRPNRPASAPAYQRSHCHGSLSTTPTMGTRPQTAMSRKLVAVGSPLCTRHGHNPRPAPVEHVFKCESVDGDSDGEVSVVLVLPKNSCMHCVIKRGSGQATGEIRIRANHIRIRNTGWNNYRNLALTLPLVSETLQYAQLVWEDAMRHNTYRMSERGCIQYVSSLSLSKYLCEQLVESFTSYNLRDAILYPRGVESMSPGSTQSPPGSTRYSVSRYSPRSGRGDTSPRDTDESGAEIVTRRRRLKKKGHRSARKNGRHSKGSCERLPPPILPGVVKARSRRSAASSAHASDYSGEDDAAAMYDMVAGAVAWGKA